MNLRHYVTGFQFNHVGGGTKTRRPIAINMKYKADCEEPRCFLLKDDSYGREEEMSLPDLQRYIESENQRLENENGFWAKVGRCRLTPGRPCLLSALETKI